MCNSSNDAFILCENRIRENSNLNLLQKAFKIVFAVSFEMLVLCIRISSYMLMILESKSYADPSPRLYPTLPPVDPIGYCCIWFCFFGLSFSPSLSILDSCKFAFCCY